MVSDGEFGKSISWSQYALERLSGFERRPIKQDAANPFKRGADRERFAEFYAELDAHEGVATTTEAICIGPIKYTGQAELQRDIDNFKAALKDVKVEEAFLPVAAPASVIPDRKNEFYKTEEELQAAIADAMRTEYKMIIDAGFLVQLDDARNAVTYDRMVPPATFEDYRRWLARPGRHHQPRHRGTAGRSHPLSRLLGQLAGPACQRRAAQGHRRSDPEGESRRLCDRGRQSAPRARMESVEGRQAGAGQVLIPGVISHATNVVEHPELVAERIVRLAKIVGRENVIAGTDCGFAQGPFHRRVHPSIMWAKLEALAAGARLASKELWA